MNKTQCRTINDLIGGFEKCKFLVENEECRSGESVFDYMYMAFCFVDSTAYYKSIAISAVLFLIFFVSLGVTADDFLCPSLLVISKKLKISQNIAGVTLLAFGNGSPDIFSSLAGIKQTRPELVIGELFGGGIFITCVVAGSIFLVSDFTSMRRPILRDMIFYLFACYFAWATVWHGSISFFHALVFLLIYVVYLATVIIGRYVNQKWKKKDLEKRKLSGKDKTTYGFQCSKKFEQTNKIGHQHPVITTKTFNSNDSDSEPTERAADHNSNIVDNAERSNNDLKSILITNSTDNKFGIDNPALDIKENVKDSATGRRLSYSVHHHFDNLVYHIAHSMENEDSDHPACTNPECDCSRAKQQQNEIASTANQRNLAIFNSQTQGSSMSIVSNQSLRNSIPNWGADSQSLVSGFSNLKDLNEIQDFLVHVCPIDLAEWQESSIPSKVYQIIKAPIYFLLLITIPVIDYENDRDNWCRILNSIHLITSPITILYVTGVYEHIFTSWLFIGITVLVCVIASMVVFFTTNHQKAPRFHYLYGFVGFIVSMLWIYALANETISLLHVIGIMLDLSDFILGLTILAFGNSIADLMSNISMAKNGFARMGISACYGGPLFNLLFGIGLPYCLLLYNNTGLHLKIDYSKIVTLSFGTASFALLTTMFLMISSNFKSKKFHGVILLCVYVFYVTTACLIELKYI